LKPNALEPEIRTGNPLVDSYVVTLQREIGQLRKQQNVLREKVRQFCDKSDGFDRKESLEQDRFTSSRASPMRTPQRPSPTI
jgi:hypothetical protein